MLNPSSYSVKGPDNTHITDGALANKFIDRIGKTHFFGSNVASDEMWNARGK